MIMLRCVFLVVEDDREGYSQTINKVEQTIYPVLSEAAEQESHDVEKNT